MARGDQIYVMRPFLQLNGVYEHHGIDCGDSTVIHYSKVESDPVIRRTPWADFSWGNPVSVKEYVASYIPDVVVERAESRLGERRYNLTANNCEHFATWCKIGRNDSRQISNFSLDLNLVDLARRGGLVNEAAQEGDPIQAAATIEQALHNVAIARHQLNSQIQQAEHEQDTWHRVAQLALKQAKEPAARAALEHKVAVKRKLPDLYTQRDQLQQMEANLLQQKTRLKQQIAIL
ncbi:MAG: lecithin retinol acyltransferase family protein [Kaiparowitsia implicata GSE-PSE-MK54-09C]|jgi:hypothetical protein|nr:lecithin retinol acyltransferase family protein [Kaiparowitsia implicata GSE-PSE-MK54-09C]